MENRKWGWWHAELTTGSEDGCMQNLITDTEDAGRRNWKTGNEDGGRLNWRTGNNEDFGMQNWRQVMRMAAG
jgi:hypothetical protein